MFHAITLKDVWKNYFFVLLDNWLRCAVSRSQTWENTRENAAWTFRRLLLLFPGNGRPELIWEVAPRNGRRALISSDFSSFQSRFSSQTASTGQSPAAWAAKGRKGGKRRVQPGWSRRTYRPAGTRGGECGWAGLSSEESWSGRSLPVKKPSSELQRREFTIQTTINISSFTFYCSFAQNLCPSQDTLVGEISVVDQSEWLGWPSWQDRPNLHVTLNTSTFTKPTLFTANCSWKKFTSCTQTK